MSRWLGVASFVAVLAGLDYAIDRARTQINPPVTVEWLTPTNGSVVSNTITLSVNAQSTVAPIAYVDFYRDGVFFKRVYNMNYLPGPSNLTVNR